MADSSRPRSGAASPALSTGPADVVNNVVYNGREGFVHHNIVGAASTSAGAGNRSSTDG